MEFTLQKIAVVALIAAATSGCSTSPEKSDAITNLPPLEIPPDLTIPDGIGDLRVPFSSTATSRRSSSGSNFGTTPAEKLLPRREGIALMRDGRGHWLKLESSDQLIWEQLVNFWQRAGFELTINRPGYAILETFWNESNDPRFTRPTRNKFRLRMEQEGKSSEIYLTHYGAVADPASGDGSETVRWQQREQDDDLESEYLRRIALFLGERIPADYFNQSETTTYPISDGALKLPEEFMRAWRKVGIALDRSGTVVTDRNRDEGTYYVTKVKLLDDIEESSSWFSSSADSRQFTESTPLKVVITAVPDGSEVTIAGEVDEDVRQRILNAIRKELK